jgi:hypothetical protein
MRAGLLSRLLMCKVSQTVLDTMVKNGKKEQLLYRLSILAKEFYFPINLRCQPLYWSLNGAGCPFAARLVRQ